MINLKVGRLACRRGLLMGAHLILMLVQIIRRLWIEKLAELE